MDHKILWKSYTKLGLQGIVIGLGYSSKIANSEWWKMSVVALFVKTS